MHPPAREADAACPPGLGPGLSGPATEDRPLAEQVVDLVFALAGRFSANFGAVTAALDLPPAQARALLALQGPVPMRKLAHQLSCDPSNVTGIVDGLERRGLVTREPDPADRRVKRLACTEAGQRQRQVLQDRLYGGLGDLLELDEDGQRQLRDLLVRALGYSPSAATPS
jgi:DNA-binding MarR family transcriptional regulator